MKFIGKTGEYFEVLEHDDKRLINKDMIDDQLSMLWFKEDGNEVTIDSQKHLFKKDEILFLTPYNKFQFHTNKAYRFVRFNTPFYCITTNDSEVGCKGILFFGSNNIPHIKPSPADLEILDTVWKMLVIEMKSNDNLQFEMLQMMLKRIIILSTRIYKNQENYPSMPPNQLAIVREFNYLIEQYFKEKHTVAEYAAILNKSPKTLSNLFKKLSDKTPLQMIQSRKMLEVRRLLKHSELPISEVGYEVGFPDVQSFSRFFKKHQGVSPSEFRLAS